MANRTKIEKLEELIKDSIGGELLEQQATSLLPPGENYGSVMYKVDFKVKKDGEVKEYHAVAKCTPLNTVTQELFNTQETFKSEIAWYTTVIPTLKKFAKDQGLERELDFFQQFYGARISLDPNSDKVDLDGVILTENLKYLGFKNVDRHNGFDLPTARSILRNLATFHAVPMAIRLQNPGEFLKSVKPFLPTWQSCSDAMQDDFTKDVHKVFERIPESVHLTDRIESRLKKSVVFAQREYREPWITALHMDFWSNNVMVTEGTSADKKCIILDLQCPGYGSPAADVAFFLLTSVEIKSIENNIDNLLKFYHEQLTENLKQLQINTEQFSFKSFLDEFNEEVKNGELAHALGHLQIILHDKEVSSFDATDPNFKYEDFADSEVIVNERHIERFKWILLEAEKRNWI